VAPEPVGEDEEELRPLRNVANEPDVAQPRRVEQLHAERGAQDAANGEAPNQTKSSNRTMGSSPLTSPSRAKTNALFPD
jgi:hypothetical protein